MFAVGAIESAPLLGGKGAASWDIRSRRGGSASSRGDDHVAYTTVEGTRLYWEDGGEGEPLLLIQGLGFSSAMWFRVLPALEARYRVIRYDARGIGRSDVPEGPYTIERAAADAVAILDAAGVDQAHVFGCSLGGIVAQEVALSHTGRVRSLMLFCTHAAGEAAVWPAPEVMQMLAERTSLAPEDAIRASIPVAYAATTDPALIEEDIKVRLEIRTSNEGYTNQLTGGIGYPGTAPRLANIKVPTLVFTGDADKLVPPANTDILADGIPGAKKVILRGGGHVIFTDQPAAFTATMIEFLDEIGAVRANH
jgi:pimeloyl-ACP methyl ester carboxylesterase